MWDFWWYVWYQSIHLRAHFETEKLLWYHEVWRKKVATRIEWGGYHMHCNQCIMLVIFSYQFHWTVRSWHSRATSFREQSTNTHTRLINPLLVTWTGHFRLTICKTFRITASLRMEHVGTKTFGNVDTLILIFVFVQYMVWTDCSFGSESARRYERSEIWWVLMTARVSFLLLFIFVSLTIIDCQIRNWNQTVFKVVGALRSLIDHFVPGTPTEVEHRLRREDHFARSAFLDKEVLKRSKFD